MKSNVLSAALIFLLVSVAIATPTKIAKHVPAEKTTGAATANLSPDELEAVTELKKMAASLKSASGLSYSSTLDITSPMAGTGAKVYSTTVTVEKPDKINLVISPIGTGVDQVYSDGTNVTIYDTSQQKYATAPAASTLAGSLISLYHAGTAIYQQEADTIFALQMALSFPVSFSRDDFLVPPDNPHTGITLTYSFKPDLLLGKPVDIVSQKISMQTIQFSITYTIDPATNLPVAVDEESSTSKGSKLLSLDESFESLQLLATPVASSTYAFTPPANATLATVPAAAAPQNQPKLLTTGTVAPDFTVTSESGAGVKLSSFVGKVVVIDFWATWCGPCQASLPHTDTIAKKFIPQGVVFLPICTWDTKDAFAAWLKTHGNLKLPFYFDPAGEGTTSIASSLYGVDGIPTQYVIGKDGKVITSFVGYDEGGDPNEAALTAALKTAL